jgi:hypothetical protein
MMLTAWGVVCDKRVAMTHRPEDFHKLGPAQFPYIEELAKLGGK